MIRYCPHCNHIGEVSLTSMSCCPDGHGAVRIPQEVARLARIGFSASYSPPQQPAGDVVMDAGRYRMIRRGQHWSIINGIGDVLRGDDVDAAIDAAIAASGRQE